MKKLLQHNILCIILGSLSILLATLFAPFWKNIWENCPWGDWGDKIIGILIASLIVAYLALYLFKKIKRASKQVIKVLTTVEFALLSLIFPRSITQYFLKLFTIIFTVMICISKWSINYVSVIFVIIYYIFFYSSIPTR